MIPPATARVTRLRAGRLVTLWLAFSIGWSIRDGGTRSKSKSCDRLHDERFLPTSEIHGTVVVGRVNHSDTRWVECSKSCAICDSRNTLNTGPFARYRCCKHWMRLKLLRSHHSRRCTLMVRYCTILPPSRVIKCFHVFYVLSLGHAFAL
jgi:hypothetical protein